MKSNLYLLIKKIVNKIRHLYLVRFGKIVRAIKPPLLPKNSNDKVLVHIGCGEFNDSRYINIDARPMPHVHYVTQDLEINQFPLDSVDLIYACHVIEHLSHRKLLPILSNWFSRLKDGGILRLSVPDFDTIIDIYRNRGKDIDSIKLPLLGGQEYDFNYHKAIFNHNYLYGLLKKAGFRAIQEWDPKSASYYKFDDCAGMVFSAAGKEYPISLNLEAVKEYRVCLSL